MNIRRKPRLAIFLDWCWINSPSVMLITMWIISLMPFIWPEWKHTHKVFFHGFIGAISVISALIFSSVREFKANKKANKLFTIIVITVLVFGVIGVFRVGSKTPDEATSPFDLFLMTHMAATIVLGFGTVMMEDIKKRKN